MPAATGVRPRARRGRTAVAGCVRLSKCFVYQQYYGWLLAWLLLAPTAADRPAAVVPMWLFLGGSVSIFACACAIDDIVGYRNGSDAANYLTGDTTRDIRGKPLLSGALTERAALWFAWGAGAAAVLCGAGAFRSLGWSAPVSAYLLYALGFALSVQYSAGLRLSFFRGGAECLLGSATAAGLLAPYVAVHEGWSADALLVASLLGTWHVMVSSCSNANDAEGDRRVGRRTLAVVAGPRVVTAVLVVIALLSWGLVWALALGTRWPWWTTLTLAPVVAAHLAQLRAGPLRGQWLKARRIGFLAYDLGFLGAATTALLTLRG
ncbi:UbiA family prenyltransferase [Streptomyces sp. NPDC050560]|uniref:UbiA family prenyltransferase n=1 Tax=Streptomyces sp. NPDC050560 TaxID=3365630 RepID=UPI00378734AC